MAYVIEGAHWWDCVELSKILREEDVKEILASRPHEPLADSLYECVGLSCKVFSVHEQGIGCIAIFGTRDAGNGVGIPWMLTSEFLFERSCRKFIRQCKGYVKLLTDDFEQNYNLVSSTNTKAHRWLVWMGFVVQTDCTRTLNGVDFHPFIYVRK